MTTSSPKKLLKALRPPKAWTSATLEFQRDQSLALRQMAAEHVQEIRAARSLFMKPERVLARALRAPDPALRENVAAVLDALGVALSASEDLVYYRAAKQDWAALRRGGASALPALGDCLLDLDPAVRKASYRAIVDIFVKMGKDAPAELTRCIRRAQRDDNMRMVTSVASYQTATGRTAAVTNQRTGELRATAGVLALCENRQFQDAETVVDHILQRCGSRPSPEAEQLAKDLAENPEDVKVACPASIVRVLIPLPALQRLLGDYAELVMDVCAWESGYSVSEAGKFKESFDVSRCVRAVEVLCGLKTSVSTHILGKVPKKIITSLRISTMSSSSETLDFKAVWHLAHEELKHRGQSGYCGPDEWKKAALQE
jgi:hypothetical protein